MFRIQFQQSINPYSKLPMSEYSIRGLEGPDRQNIKLIFVTYVSEFKKPVLSVYNKIAEKYATVHLFDQYIPQKVQQQCKNNPLTKRDIIFVVLVEFKQEQINEYLSQSQKYDDWYHYGNSTQKIQLPQKVIVLSYSKQQNLDEELIFKMVTKNLQLQFTWVGVACRLGCQLSEFVTILTKEQNFQKTKTEFMKIFLDLLNNKLKTQKSTLNQIGHSRLLQIFSECKIESEYQLQQIQTKIQTLVCQKFNVRTIISGITEHRYLKLLKSRNYFKIIWIEESTLARFENFKKMLKNDEDLRVLESWINLQNFLTLDDYWYTNFVQKVGKVAEFTINRTKDQRWEEIIQKNYSNIIREFRPDFDTYFLSICQILKTRAGCIKEAVGSIIVKNKRIISTGYNGTPIGSINCFHGGCRVCDNSEQMNTIVLSCNCIHAEYSCIIEAGIQSTPGCILYTTRLPCLWCSKVIIQAKIKMVVYLQTQYPPLSYKNEEKVLQIFRQAGVELREFKKNSYKFEE